jgi:glycosyltransferase involved in cell wall biosynthesis
MSKKRNISFLVPVLKGGGAERNVINLVNNLDKEKYQVFIVAGNVEGKFQEGVSDSIKIINLKCNGLFSFLIKLCRYLKIENPDILVSALPHINTISAISIFFLRSKTKLVITEHTTFSMLPSTARTLTKRLAAKFILPTLMKIFYPVARVIICVSNGVAEDLSLILKNSQKIKIIYNPVTEEKIYSLSEENLVEDSVLFEKEPVIIAIGRLVKAKDYPTLLNAFKIVLEKKSAKLIILGEGPEEVFIKKLVKDLRILEKVFFLGFKKNPYKYLKNSSVFVLSSIREGFGNVIVEAMACGVPVVATDCKSGPAEIIQNGVNGILVEQQNPEKLAEAILEILNNSEFSKNLSEAGKLRAQYFSIEKSVKNYEQIFSNL